MFEKKPERVGGVKKGNIKVREKPRGEIQKTSKRKLFTWLFLLIVVVVVDILFFVLIIIVRLLIL